ncbi:MAG: hypothetical protein FJ225_08950 [Lentisphaerae bacterium]|nr:hypothetical protein [Lentisphaerota bacterium]
MSELIPLLLCAPLLLGLPLLGVWLSGGDPAVYAEFPPVTHRLAHAAFAWPVFWGMALLVAGAVVPFAWRVAAFPFREASPAPPAARGRFPAWGWAGVAWLALAWAAAWTRMPWLAPVQAHTFTPIWLGYVVVVNALTQRRAGKCMLTRRPGYLLLLFPVSAAFWWFFEYLNRFVQTWYYNGVGVDTPLKYFALATPPFATVLPAVTSTYELLGTFPRLGGGLEAFARLRPRRPRALAAVLLAAASASLLGIGIWPDFLFPLLWISPLAMIPGMQALLGRPTIFAGIRRGDWRRCWLLSLAGLLCGLCWETWNFRSLARWVYEVPFVDRFRLFAMPLLGYAGYLPFGLECGVVADIVAGAGGRTEPENAGGRKEEGETCRC